MSIQATSLAQLLQQPQMERPQEQPQGSLAQLALFMGPGSRTYDRGAQNQAAQMEAAGVPRETIFKQTGAFRGPDGDWRQEIPDEGAKLTGAQGSVLEAIHHQELKKAYPFLGVVPANITEPGIFDSQEPTGSWNPVTGITANGLDAGLHEVQHAISGYEGRPQRTPDGYQGLHLPGGGMTPEQYKAYQALMYEAESRAASARREMTPQQRRNVFPEQSYDIPWDKLTR